MADIKSMVMRAAFVLVVIYITLRVEAVRKIIGLPPAPPAV